MPISDDIIKQVKGANPGLDLEILSHDTLPDQVLARVPARGVYTNYLQMRDAGQRVEAAEMLCGASILFPDKAGLQAMFDAHPALPVVWATELGEMAGATAKATRKKV